MKLKLKIIDVLPTEGHTPPVTLLELLKYKYFKTIVVISLLKTYHNVTLATRGLDIKHWLLCWSSSEEDTFYQLQFLTSMDVKQ